MNRWFVCQNDKVTGPFTTDEVKAQVAGGQLSADCLIWGRPQHQWQTMAWWTKELPSMGQPTATAATSTALFGNTGQSQQLWHYAVEGVSKGPLSRAELINELRGIKNKDEILVWTKGMKAWTDLYDFHDLLDEMGLNRREYPRANINGSVVVKNNDQTYIGQLKSISQGGFGASHIDSNLSIGQLINVEIKSESIGEVILAKAAVQYLSEMGYYGFRFHSISQEAKSQIANYIIKTRQMNTPANAA